MPEYSFDIVPLSRLFVKDARPMTKSDAGLGAQWPRPDHVWHAVFHAFHTAWPEKQEWEHWHSPNEKDKHLNSSFRFGALKTAGPFPKGKNGKLYFPMPLDWNYRLVSGEGTDLPKPLTHVFQNRVVGKQNPPQWISSADYATYLNGYESDLPEEAELYDTERDIGIVIQSDTGTTEKGKLYQAEYIRLQEGVKLAMEASCEVHNGYTKQTTDLFEKLGVPFYTVLGGQQEVSLVEGGRGSLDIPKIQIERITSQYLRWTLLTPAVFPKIDANLDKGINPHPGGWLPSWIDSDTGKVLLTNEVSPRGEKESREAYRARIRKAGQISAKLIAARIGNPLAFSGWDMEITTKSKKSNASIAKTEYKDKAPHPKPTVLAVPAGSCYVFDCGSTENAQALAKALNWPKRRSALFGERGFGMGICSSYPENRI